ncbi:hypothetical protein J6590_053502 [Homalodisca vitripennis]|nr:hypothetical protein J6590_053502 [Homalodisca vitripennis]
MSTFGSKMMLLRQLRQKISYDNSLVLITKIVRSHTIEVFPMESLGADGQVTELSYRKPLPILRQRSKSSGLVDNVIAESRRPFSWFVALLYFRVLPLHFSKHTKLQQKQTLLISLLKKHLKLVFILDHTPPPKMRVPPAEGAAEARADVDERKTSLEIVPISKISNSRGADQKYKLNCNGKAIMYRANHVMPRGRNRDSRER